MELREIVARAIYAKRPDCHNKPWPLETGISKRAYLHNPIAAIDLSYIYADAALAAVAQAGARGTQSFRTMGELGESPAYPSACASPPVAQLDEQGSSISTDAGSSPAGRTNSPDEIAERIAGDFIGAHWVSGGLIHDQVTLSAVKDARRRLAYDIAEAIRSARAHGETVDSIGGDLG